MAQNVHCQTEEFKAIASRQQQPNERTVLSFSEPKSSEAPPQRQASPVRNKSPGKLSSKEEVKPKDKLVKQKAIAVE